MNVAEQWPARTDSNGVTWFRPARDAGSDFSQWGWTSQREQAHPDYRAHFEAQTGGLHPERLCGGDCSGCVSEAEGAPPYRWGFPLSTERPAEVRPLPGGGFALVPVDPLPTEPLDALPAEFVSVGYIDETQRGPHTVVHTGTGETAPRVEDRLPLSRSWNCDDQGRTLCGASVCGTCDGGGCFDCID
ncbi:hypothetical protein SEA_GENGAR_74 [Mycobacterium phage Gengar]|uniref:Uncharacterized protein n=1 Tax=Mycobacterium phage Gengar TaxID=1891963 RepID=A0A1C9EGV5_9CAUD|nr:hypothetical protein SEA_GENGAR_74 [Mycobacterium phage Gengar]AON96729.1 hypothetical protein SEA_GENGAR_74 [Mycobacterium phage Gengar]